MATVLHQYSEGVLTITLNRPEKLNAFNREMAVELQEVLNESALRKDIRCVRLTGAGKAFSAGQDLAEVAAVGGPDIEKILREHFNPIVQKIRDLPKPVVAVVNGVAAGAGANIALCCDVVVACKSASFVQAFSKIGLIPDSGGTFFLPRLVGWQRASSLMLLSEKISAEEAAHLGLIYQVFEDESLSLKSEELAKKLASLPALGLALTKQALQASFTNSLQAQLTLEKELQQKAALSEEFQQAVRRFLEKK